MTLIMAARTMMADLLLPILFWDEVVNTACYVQNRVLVTKPQNKTPYELLLGRTPIIGFMRPFDYPVTILNTLDPLGKFDGKVDEGFLVRYSVSCKAFRVFNSKTRIVQETLHINFLENKPNVAGSGPTGLFDIDTLTKTMNYQPVTVGNQSNHSAGVQEQFDAEKAREESKEPEFEGRKPESEVHVSPSSKFEDFSDNSINEVNAADSLVPAVGQIFTNSTNTFSAAGPSNAAVSPTHGKSQYPDDPNMPELEDITYSDDEEDVGAAADFTNLETSITVSPILTTRVHKDHHVTQIIGDLYSATQKRSMTRVAKDQVDTPMVEKSKLDEDREGKAVDPSHYRGMIGTLLYLIVSRPNLQFAICMCARYQARPTKKHDSSVAVTTFADADHAGYQDTRRSTSGSVQFMGERLISWSLKRYHFIKEQFENGVIELYFVNTEYQLADLYTNALGRERTEFLINKLGMRSFTPEMLKQLMNEEDE
nr:retrovirus-related Pol polyprotein from transposon TNT 1-94 [Tanacetum cinerariifolium]